MKQKEDLVPKNSKGQCHGYHQYYNTDDKTYYRTMFKNNIQYGYTEYHASIFIDNDKYNRTRYYIV